MQKKLIAVAMAGAFGAPALALAQTSTVQIYGTINLEYGYVDAGNFRGALGANGGSNHNVDIMQTPGSNIGFKGEEKLGGGLSAWFQCESSADVRGADQDGFCSRNSAIGFKGGFGNVFIGRWDTPFKRTGAPTSVGGGDTGLWGTTFLLTGGSTSTQGSDLDSSATVGTNGGGGRATFRRRQSHTVNYDTPNFGGFQMMAQYSSTNQATGVSSGTTNSKARLMSIGGQYSAGPIFVSAAYEKHKDFGGPAVFDGADDSGWHVGAAYTWGPVRLGAHYTRQKFDAGATGASSDLRVSAWQFGFDWRIAGPHGLRGAYTQADDTKGSATGVAGASIAGSGSNRPLPNVTGVGAVGNTGAKQYQLSYVYTFSKRTEVKFGYIRVDNEANAFYRLGGLGAVANGSDQDAWAMGIRHTF